MRLGDVPRSDEDDAASLAGRDGFAELNHSLIKLANPLFSISGSLKRPSSRGCSSDIDHTHYKKRRKQSKPVKIEAVETISNEHDSGEENTSNDGNAVGVHNEEMFVRVVPSPSHQCPYCAEVFTSDSSLRVHFQTNHVLEVDESRTEIEKVSHDQPQIPLNLSSIYTLNSPKQENLLDNMYSQWHSEVKMSCEDFPKENHESVKNSPAEYAEPFSDRRILLPRYLPLASPIMFPSLPSSSATSLPEPKSVQCRMNLPIRVFNPEAFCQLCNKEFCNKYFLKTHKANKHGIYVETPQPSVNNLMSLPPAPLISSVNLDSVQQLSVMSSAQENLTNPSPATQLSEDLATSQLMGNTSSKAFCDICNKKFCNRYFVRRHKAKIHGIADDLYTTTNSIFLNLPEYAHKKDCEEKGNSLACCNIKPFELEPSTAMHSDSKELDPEICHTEVENSTNSLHNDKITTTNHADGKECQTLDMTHFDNTGKEERKITENFENLNTATSPEKSLTNTSPDALKDASFSVQKLKQLGVINADAFCEICCKEYCNKYFLRTHKMKRHGITFTEGEWQGKDDKSNENGNGSCHHAQTSPLNLIMGDNGNNSSDSGERLQSDSDDIECDVCRRKFQSLYLMHMHRAYLHAVVEVEGKEVGSTKECMEENVTERNNFEFSVPAEEESFVKNVVNIKDEKCEKYDSNDDLEKLKTMIMQLNDLSVSKVSVCSVCSQDMHTPHNLKTHMVTEHGIFIEESTGFVVETHSTLNSAFNSSEFGDEKKCLLCKKEFVSEVELKQHIEESHGYATPQISTSNMHIDQDGIKIEMDFSEKNQYHSGASTSSDKRTTLAPTNSFCEICNKELCNKYFMKTHMQRMHGIEIENGAQIGGVICDVCNKELCSKYFLRVHKQNTHGIIEEGQNPQQNRESAMAANASGSQTENDNALKPLELGDLSHRYFTHFTEVCPLCSRRFRSTKWLKAHLFNDHGESGAEKWKGLENSGKFSSSHTKKSQVSKSLIQSHHNVPISSHSLTLKIPSNWSIQEQNGTCIKPHGQSSSENVPQLDSQRVLTNLLGSSDSSHKSYHCSYCPFSTTILAFLFVHEKSHTGLSSATPTHIPKTFQCPVCLQSFNQIDVYQHHVVTHKFSGLINPFFNPAHSYPYSQTLGCIESAEQIFHHSPGRTSPDQGRDKTKKSESIDTQDKLPAVGSGSGRCKFRCSKCFQRFKSRELCAAHVASKHGPAIEGLPPPTVPDATRIMVAPQKHFKCDQCNFSSIHSVILKKHIRKTHKSEALQGGDTETRDVLQDVKKKLEDAAKVSKIPASYAVPQSQPHVEGFLMQPFLLEEPHQKFFPSLVFLPVKEKMSEPATVSFMLTPA